MTTCCTAAASCLSSRALALSDRLTGCSSCSPAGRQPCTWACRAWIQSSCFPFEAATRAKAQRSWSDPELKPRENTFLTLFTHISQPWANSKSWTAHLAIDKTPQWFWKRPSARQRFCCFVHATLRRAAGHAAAHWSRERPLGWRRTRNRKPVRTPTVSMFACGSDQLLYSSSAGYHCLKKGLKFGGWADFQGLKSALY